MPPAAPAVAPVDAPQEYPLADGSVVAIDVLEVGGSVSVEGAPAPAGTYTLMDGTVISTDEAGIITAIGTPAAPAEDMSQKVSALEQQLAEIKAHYDRQFSEQEQAFASAMEDQKSKVEGLKNIVVEMMSVPAADPIKKEKHFESRDEKIARFLEFTKKIK